LLSSPQVKKHKKNEGGKGVVAMDEADAEEGGGGG
jgi:hypothetical protein